MSSSRPRGERIFTTTFLQHPQAGRRDGLIHAIYGGVYGKATRRHRRAQTHRRPDAGVDVILGLPLPAGLTRYASRVFGDDYRDNLFAAMFNLQKVTRHALEPGGATFRAAIPTSSYRTAATFIRRTCSRMPTAACCDRHRRLVQALLPHLAARRSPTCWERSIASAGRARRELEDPRGRRLAWNTMKPAELAKLLDDGRPAVQNPTLHEFARLGSSAVSALDDVLRTSRSADARRNAVWALTRIQTASAREGVRLALNDREPKVRQAALHSAGSGGTRLRCRSFSTR